MNIPSCLKHLLTKIFIAAALVVGIVTQLFLVALLCSILPLQVGFALLVKVYYGFQRWVGYRSTAAEADRWLAERSRSAVEQNPMRRLKRISLWVPTICASVLILIFPEMIGIIMHVRHPGPAKLLGYGVSFPSAWIVYERWVREDHAWSSSDAFECKGPLRSGFVRSWRMNLAPSDLYKFQD